jgi:hypothetical protein
MRTEHDKKRSTLIRLVFFLAPFLLVTGFGVQAQDTARKKTIDITSTFKPVLRNAAKINFNATVPAVDSTKPKLTYSIPTQFMFLNYQPTPLRPVALEIDTSSDWGADNYIKAGIGSVYQPFIQSAFSFGNQKNNFFNAFADQYTTKGTLPFQKSSLTNVGLSGTIKTQNKLEWDGRLGFSSDGYYLYGYRPDTLKFSKDMLQQSFQTYDLKLGLCNTELTEYGLGYHPNLKVSVFSDNHDPQATEANTVLELPLQKRISDNFSFNLGFTASLTDYRRTSLPDINNNLYYLSPALQFRNTNVFIQADATPSWDDKQFNLLPDFLAEISTNDQHFTLQFGWIGYYDKGSYQRYSTINPWLAQPATLLDTRVTERYAGFKGSLTNHITYSVKIGLNDYINMPLFVNDSTDGKTFVIRYEPDVQAFQMHGEIAYTQGEQFSISASLNLNNYGHLLFDYKAYGLLPLEFKTNLRWQILKDLWIRSDLWAFTGAPWRGNDNKSYVGDGAFDLNAGIEFRILRQLNLWLQMNNLLNDQYERWHQYESYGFNLLLGVVFTFGQK